MKATFEVLRRLLGLNTSSQVFLQLLHHRRCRGKVCQHTHSYHVRQGTPVTSLRIPIEGGYCTSRWLVFVRLLCCVTICPRHDGQSLDGRRVPVCAGWLGSFGGLQSILLRSAGRHHLHRHLLPGCSLCQLNRCIRPMEIHCVRRITPAHLLQTCGADGGHVIARR